MGCVLSKFKALDPVIRPIANEVKVKPLTLTRPLVASQREKHWIPWVKRGPQSPTLAGLSP